jgi:bifunctional DNase/RNase
MTDTGGGPTDERLGLDPGIWRLAVVAGVRMDLPGEYPEVLVHEAVSPWRELAIPVAMADGNAIAYAWRGATTPRPLTHALFTDVLERHNVQLEAVRITARRGRSFFAELDTTGPGGRQVISCRPSDAFALVLRQRMPTPVLVADSVFDPEDTDVPSSSYATATGPLPAVEAAASPTGVTGSTDIEVSTDTEESTETETEASASEAMPSDAMPSNERTGPSATGDATVTEGPTT